MAALQMRNPELNKADGCTLSLERVDSSSGWLDSEAQAFHRFWNHRRPLPWCLELIRATLLIHGAPLDHVWFGGLSRVVSRVLPTPPFSSLWNGAPGGPNSFRTVGSGDTRGTAQRTWFWCENFGTDHVGVLNLPE